jgi:hypothetical protein
MFELEDLAKLRISHQSRRKRRILTSQRAVKVVA